MRFLAMIAATLVASHAQAAVVTYDYQGQDLDEWEWTSCIAPGEELPWEPCTKTPIPDSAFWGSVTFDLDHIPGGSLANSTISFYASEVWESDNQWSMKYEFSGPGGSDSLEWVGDEATPSDFSKVAALVRSTGWVFAALHPWLAEGRLWMTFDNEANVIDWEFSRWEGSPDTDWMSTTGGDGYTDHYSSGPGTWTKSVDPSPVPLPAAAISLVTGIASLAGLRTLRRRQDRTA
ncbi:VPLPA-CTERM sorting domain-containing protein [Tabrizicola sp. J26]|uniref:VPLPA-CTERM sorting domain-containing protein n=1 Tax=Alitabrizicola rongguiensis TaxID=2909234 RepID=UPI001F372A44|nr:VPLPA-CTERM sorting domain-containing protein [Tabrizicola rongguiensis]MCF1711165.1 VPLPA-CTERM sorting domain-containing protein [Tabrizicola rongguiensis]